MQTKPIQPGDMVECEINGRAFRADIQAIDDRRLLNVPICRSISYRYAQAKQIKRHWRLAGRNGARRGDGRGAGMPGSPQSDLAVRAPGCDSD